MTLETRQISEPSEHALLLVDNAAAALAAAGVVVLVLDPNLRIVSASGATEDCLGAPVCDVDQRSLLEYLPSSAQDAMHAAHSRLMQGTHPNATVETERIDAHGLRCVVFELTPLAPSTHRQGVMCVGRDITSQRVSERISQQIFTLAAHELRTPLTAMKGYAQLALKRLQSGGDSPLVQRMLTIIGEQTERMTSVVDRCLDIARMQQGQLRLMCTAFDLSEHVQGTINQHLDHLPNLRVHTNSDAPLVVEADRQRITQVIQVLLDNALVYAAISSPINVTIRRAGACAQVTVRDYGTSIAAGMRPVVFESWYQIQNNLAHSASGLGLGLNIVKLIIERHGGHVWSESPGGPGNIYGFSLPLAT